MYKIPFLTNTAAEIKKRNDTSRSNSKTKRGFISLCRKLYSKNNMNTSINSLNKKQKFSFVIPPTHRQSLPKNASKNSNTITAKNLQQSLFTKSNNFQPNLIRIKIQQRAKQKYQQSFRINMFDSSKKIGQSTAKQLLQLLKKNNQNYSNQLSQSSYYPTYQLQENKSQYPKNKLDQQNNLLKKVITSNPNNSINQQQFRHYLDFRKSKLKIQQQLKLNIQLERYKESNNNEKVFDYQKQHQLKIDSIIKSKNIQTKQNYCQKFSNQFDNFGIKEIKTIQKHHFPQQKSNYNDSYVIKQQPKIEQKLPNPNKNIQNKKLINSIIKKPTQQKQNTKNHRLNTQKTNNQKIVQSDNSLEQINLDSQIDRKSELAVEFDQSQSNLQECQAASEIMDFIYLIDCLGQFPKKSKSHYYGIKSINYLMASYYLSQQFYFYRHKTIEILTGKKKTSYFHLKYKECQQAVKDQEIKQRLQQLINQQSRVKQLVKNCYEATKQAFPNSLGQFAINWQNNYHKQCCLYLNAQFNQIYQIYSKNKLKAQIGRRCCYLIETYSALLNLNGEKVKEYQQVDQIKTIDTHLNKYKKIMNLK